MKSLHETDPKNTGENGHNLDLCYMCQKDMCENECSYKNCDDFEYRDSINYLCEACEKDCKQYAQVEILVCKKYKKCVSTKE